MIKTQIQVPEGLLAEIRGIAESRGWSLAEAFRRGGELLVSAYRGESSRADWQPPTVRNVRWLGLDAASLRELAVAEEAGDAPGKR